MEGQADAQMCVIDYGGGWRAIGEQIDLVGRARMNQRRTQRGGPRSDVGRDQRSESQARIGGLRASGTRHHCPESVTQHGELIARRRLRDDPRRQLPRQVEPGNAVFTNGAHARAQIEDQCVPTIGSDGLMTAHVKTRDRERHRAEGQRLEPEERIEP